MTFTENFKEKEEQKIITLSGLVSDAFNYTKNYIKGFQKSETNTPIGNILRKISPLFLTVASIGGIQDMVNQNGSPLTNTEFISGSIVTVGVMVSASVISHAISKEINFDNLSEKNINRIKDIAATILPISAGITYSKEAIQSITNLIQNANEIVTSNLPLVNETISKVITNASDLATLNNLAIVTGAAGIGVVMKDYGKYLESNKDSNKENNFTDYIKNNINKISEKIGFKDKINEVSNSISNANEFSKPN